MVRPVNEVVDIGHEIGGECRPVDARIGELAERQHGVVARRQLLAMGLGRGAIEHRVAQRRLHPLYSGVYAVGHTRLSVRGRWMAAVLACGAGALLSHRCAGHLRGILRTASARIDVTVPGRSRPGVRALKAALHDYREPLAYIRSDLEQLFLDSCREAGLPLPAVNVFLGDKEVDALWKEQKVVVELDGYGSHSSRAAFEEDRARDAALRLAGYRVLRITDRRLEREPQAVFSDVRRLLAG
jgi:hypothetical protein